MEQDHVPATETPAKQVRGPWNKGKLVGAKPPLRPSHVWSIRTKLQIEGKKRDLALFNLAIDSKLRGCDVVAVRGDAVAPSGYAMDRATVRQRKTGRPVSALRSMTPSRLPRGSRADPHIRPHDVRALHDRMLWRSTYRAPWAAGGSGQNRPTGIASNLAERLGRSASNDARRIGVRSPFLAVTSLP